MQIYNTSPLCVVVYTFTHRTFIADRKPKVAFPPKHISPHSNLWIACFTRCLLAYRQCTCQSCVPTFKHPSLSMLSSLENSSLLNLFQSYPQVWLVWRVSSRRCSPYGAPTPSRRSTSTEKSFSFPVRKFESSKGEAGFEPGIGFESAKGKSGFQKGGFEVSRREERGRGEAIQTSFHEGLSTSLWIALSPLLNVGERGVNANAVWERQGKGGVNVLLCQALSLMTQERMMWKGGGRGTLELCPLDGLGFESFGDRK